MTKQQILDDFYSVAVSVIDEYQQNPVDLTEKIDQLWFNSCYKALTLNSYRPEQDYLPSKVLITDVWDFVPVIDRPVYQEHNHPFYQAWSECCEEQ